MCGDLSSFDIRKVVVDDTIVKNPIGYKTEQTLKISSRVLMELLEKKSISPNDLMQIPSQTRVVKSLVYAYRRPSTQYQLSNEVVEITRDILGEAPILPQPSLTDSPISLIPTELQTQGMMSQMVSVLRRISKQVSETPEGIRSNQDIAGNLRSVSKNLELFNLRELEQFFDKVVSSTVYPSKKMIEGLLMDVIAMTGTNPSTMFILKKVEFELKVIGVPTQKIFKLCESIQTAIKSIKTPTTHLVQEIIKLINKLKTGRADGEQQVMTSTILQLSNLLHHAYVNHSTMLTKFPVRIYGIFGTENSNVLVRNYIPLLKEMLKLSNQQQNKHRSLVLISALGKLGHIDAAEDLVKAAQGVNHEEPMVRVLAVHSLRNVAKKYPNVIRPILLAIINNLVEHPDVRVAAIDILPWAQPSYADLQKIAVRSWYDTSNQVSSFARSTFENLVHTEVPELKTVGIKARNILHMFKPSSYGFQYSKNVHLGTFVRYLLSSVSSKYSYTATKEPEALSRLFLRNDFFTKSSGMGLKFNIQTFAMYSQGLEIVTDYALQLGGYLSNANSDIKDELYKIANAIQLETRVSPPFMAFFEYSSMGQEQAGLITAECLIKMALSVKSNLEGQFAGTYVTVRNELSLEMIMPTEAGLQITGRIQNPTFVMANASASWDLSDMSQPKVAFSVFPIVNAKSEANYMVVSPYSGSGYPVAGEFIGTGVSMGLHVASPLDMDMSLRKGEVDLKIKAPEEVLMKPVEIDVFEGYVMPFTVRSDLESVKPVDNAQDQKKILGGERLKKVI